MESWSYSDAMTSLPPIWEKVLKQGDSTNLLRELGPFDYVKKDVISMYAHCDLVQFDATTFATVKLRAQFETAVPDSIVEFFWAPSANILLRTVCGCAEIPIEAPAEPPEELLVATGCTTCGQIRAFAKKKGEDVSEHWVLSTIPTVQYYTGMRSSVGRFRYYFNCALEESVETKDWDKEPVMVIGYSAELPTVLQRTEPSA